MAFLLFRKIFNLNLIQGRTTIGIVNACIYYACKMYQILISFHEIISLNTNNRHEFFACYKLLSTQFNLKSNNLKPIMFVSRYCNELEVPYHIEKKVMETMNNLKNYDTNGKKPKSIIAAIIYIICKNNGNKLNQTYIADKLKTNPITIRSRIKELKKVL
ncbi:hypothetical protein LCGC14_0697510 [marine sediment metagenome]|uniref:Transcription factor TFIIB cyclin-like domain-containing protein n=1 Tax=marine sediment metagenome TaxID=412755 RepID=A0A0F9T4Q6_9ZZZZ